ncbi:hypothetical protein CALVIDRAFT_596349 [Calocera viscosa TUFC12733]|uniref:Uncharacterized protein n=1 Tax=Calocera viscosa (strain TUFC12733) TaxID=1330018 RepID=A0A167PEI2_CALVF|nr:hypothetical protein CALVIDRAFT_596349 [Calocera viscosa TUFC12733]
MVKVSMVKARRESRMRHRKNRMSRLMGDEAIVRVPSDHKLRRTRRSHAGQSSSPPDGPHTPESLPPPQARLATLDDISKWITPRGPFEEPTDASRVSQSAKDAVSKLNSGRCILSNEKKYEIAHMLPKASWGQDYALATYQHVLQVNLDHRTRVNLFPLNAAYHKLFDDDKSIAIVPTRATLDKIEKRLGATPPCTFYDIFDVRNENNEPEEFELVTLSGVDHVIYRRNWTQRSVRVFQRYKPYNDRLSSLADAKFKAFPQLHLSIHPLIAALSAFFKLNYHQESLNMVQKALHDRLYNLLWETAAKRLVPDRHGRYPHPGSQSPATFQSPPAPNRSIMAQYVTANQGTPTPDIGGTALPQGEEATGPLPRRNPRRSTVAPPNVVQRDVPLDQHARIIKWMDQQPSDLTADVEEHPLRPSTNPPTTLKGMAEYASMLVNSWDGSRSDFSLSDAGDEDGQKAWVDPVDFRSYRDRTIHSAKPRTRMSRTLGSKKTISARTEIAPLRSAKSMTRMSRMLRSKGTISART